MRKKPRSKWMVFAVTGIANFGFSFSSNSLNLALPFLREEFGVTQGDVSWLALVYTLIPCCMLLLFGNLGDSYGYKRQFQAGFLLFAVFSVFAPLLSPNIGVLVFFRALQGVAYSMIISITQAVIYRTFDDSERGKALGINVVFVSAGLISGPTIGGFLLAYFSWHSIFYVCGIFGALGYLGTAVALENDAVQNSGRERPDFAGSAFFALLIAPLSIALNFSDEWGFLSAKFGIAILLSAAGLLLFIRKERYTRQPIMPLNLFRNRTFIMANGVSFLSYTTQQLTFYLFPFFLADIIRLSSDWAGMILIASSVVMMIFSPIGGALTDRFGPKPPVIAGTLLFALACLLTTFFTEQTGLPYIILVLALIGAGSGLSTPGFNVAIIGSVPKNQAGIASGLLATARNLGLTCGTTLASVMLTVRGTHYTSLRYPETASHLMAQRDTYFVGIALVLGATVLMACLPPPKHESEEKQEPGKTT